MTTAEETCARAAEIIRKRGWCQNTMEIDGRVCASRALILAGREQGDWGATDPLPAPRDPWPVYGAARELMTQRLHAKGYMKPVANDMPYPYIVDYNDEEGRTAEEVIALLEGSSA